ncbi:TIGR03086 family metal-binding protein [Rugosimonospora africana]|uniref:TIGR03086 family protein n=1 Tax=Rugosimonospora africana TaxID=556532 RepID=A0A8J3QPG5_9ACTN|nr:TIGR03086 family metal-binding protein [Rugosimonospora africana]GIH14643.1 TIGR03086 family protein [Rugosimonospora africana]
MDLAALYQRSIDGFEARVAQVRPDQWASPTPCPGWDVRALVNHVIGEERWAVPLFGGATIEELGDRFSGDLLGDDPRASAADAARQARAVVTRPGVMRRTVHLSFGDAPAEEYLRQLLADHVVHSWDLAVAIGADRHLDPDAVHAVAEWFAEHEDMYRQGGAIGPRAEVPGSANEQDQLIGAYGRDPAHH